MSLPRRRFFSAGSGPADEPRRQSHGTSLTAAMRAASTNSRGPLATVLVLSIGLVLACAANPNDIERLVLGNHVLTLQWLQAENEKNIGKAKIYEKDGKIRIAGYQKEKNKGNIN